MEIIKVAHAIVLSSDLKKAFFEKNTRYGGKLTLFGGKVNDLEDEVTAIIREINEETGIEISKKDLLTYLGNDKLTLNGKLYIGTIFILILTNNQVNTLLLYSQDNVGGEIDSLNNLDFAFEDTFIKVRDAVKKIKRETI